MYLHRTLVISDRKTSIALERVFWDAIDRISNGNWRHWVLNAIENKRQDVGRATHLRGVLLDAAMRGQLHASALTGLLGINNSSLQR
jgi:predicted DNA-binding ribbon-helix-helix protein